jgi:GNAT superfamily N-acetyltransferase
MQLRAAVDDDLARVAALGRWVWLDSYAASGVSHGVAAYVEGAFGVPALRESLQREPMWLIEAGADLLAWAELDSRTADAVELCRLYVAPPQQGRGLGAQLLRHVRQTHAHRAVWLTAWEGNAGALRFYRREGAQLLGEAWFELDGQRHRNERLGWPAWQETVL